MYYCLKRRPIFTSKYSAGPVCTILFLNELQIFLFVSTSRTVLILTQEARPGLANLRHAEFTAVPNIISFDRQASL